MIHYRKTLMDYCIKPIKFKILDDKEKNYLNVERTKVTCVTELSNTITKPQIEKIIEIFGRTETYYTMYDETRKLSKGFVVTRFK